MSRDLTMKRRGFPAKKVRLAINIVTEEARHEHGQSIMLDHASRIVGRAACFVGDVVL